MNAAASARDPSFAPWPQHAPDELEAAHRVLASGKTNYWTGTEGREFDREYAAKFGRERAVALHNGIQALELALIALGVGPGDEVITTPRTFIASASAAVMRGATPVLVDVDRDSGNLSAATVQPAITKRTKAIIPVHLGGWPVDMPELMDLARAHGIAVIEDCAQAHGATVDGRPVGAFGDLAAFSICQDKILTTGGKGGLLAMDQDAWWRATWAHKDHGKSYQAIYEREHPPGFRRVYESFGANGRMLEVQAAIGRLQLRKLPDWSGRRHAIGTRIDTQGVPCYAGSTAEIYLEKAFRDAGLAPAERLSVARELGETSLGFLCHPTLSDDAVVGVIEVVGEVLGRATR